MNNSRISKVLLVRSVLVNDLCTSITKQHVVHVHVVMGFSHELLLKSTAQSYTQKKGTGSFSSEAVLIFTQREDTQVPTPKPVL